MISKRFQAKILMKTIIVFGFFTAEFDSAFSYLILLGLSMMCYKIRKPRRWR